MEPTLDRRNDRSERVPVRIAVELGQGDFGDAFDADALNFSSGGISMRAACLPDVRSRLLCRFQCMPSGATVTAQGEVVWAHLDGEHSGEFGLAFVDLDPKTEWLIEEMIAEHAALAQGKGGSNTESSATVTTLELEGSPEPIEATLARRDAGGAVFEQPLDLLSLGRGVLARAGEAEGRAGHIAGVELRMVGNVPMLAVTVAFEDARPYGEFTWSGAEAAPSQAPAPLHDTEPDLDAPPEPKLSHAVGAAQVTVTEFSAAEVATESPSPSAVPYALGAEEPDRRAAAPQPSGASAPAWTFSPLDQRAPVAPAREPALAARDDLSRSFAIDRDDESELDAELEAFSTPAWKPALRGAVHALRAQWAVLLPWLATLSGSAAQRALPKLRGTLLRVSATVRTSYRKQIGPQLGAARRLLLSLLPGRRRRTTGSRSAVKRSSASLGRTLLLGVLGAGAAGFGVYALAPSRHTEDLGTHRSIKPDAPLVETPVEASAAPAAVSAAQAEPTAAPSVPNAVAAVPVAAPAAAVAMPTAERVPASSPFAVDVRQSGTPSKVSRHKLRFGAAQLQNARRFALRMSAPIQSLQGTPDKGGFTLLVPGCLSLDRAGPISSALKSVTRAMVMNKGDHAELSIRFADGKQPAYQVTAEGSTLYVAIEE
jgi:hypothetical protein